MKHTSVTVTVDLATRNPASSKMSTEREGKNGEKRKRRDKRKGEEKSQYGAKLDYQGPVPDHHHLEA